MLSGVGNRLPTLLVLPNPDIHVVLFKAGKDLIPKLATKDSRPEGIASNRNNSVFPTPRPPNINNVLGSKA